jgi:uncharacterized protein
MPFIHPILGGVLIGLSATFLLLWLGRIAGISGMLSSIITRPSASQWQLVFFIGLLLGAAIVKLSGVDTGLIRTHLPLWLTVLGGLLVGLGTVVGGGCTSGHGVCGLGRASLRSLVATCTFLVVAIISTYLLRHVWGVL